MAKETAKTTPKDFFLNLLSIVALYVSATSLGTLIFQYINHVFPDPLEYVSTNDSLIRFAISSIVVFFPVYIWLGVYMQKGYQKDPGRKEVAIRRWLVYFTLFAAAMFIIGDVVALLMKFLEGELTVRFFLKIATILSIAGLIFGYYLWDLRQKKDREVVKAFAYGVGCLVVAVVATNLLVIGSPVEQRRRLFDERRVSDLQYLQSEIVFYWQAKGELPAELGELEDDIRGIVPPTDPATEETYVYKVTDDLSFELCTTFDTEDNEEKARPRAESVYYLADQADWTHGPGYTCFERHIDPEVIGQEDVKLPRSSI